MKTNGHLANLWSSHASTGFKRLITLGIHLCQLGIQGHLNRDTYRGLVHFADLGPPEAWRGGARADLGTRPGFLKLDNL